MDIRPFTVSRKNWLFAASTKGADASASIFSLIETAKANRLSPFDYIEYILEIMPWIDIIQLPEKIDWFMPWSD
ncbi:transposase domain-containing protein [Catenibacterium mitsuokai]|uniref:transposase domain-containing protein n=1 Tax=Catenibacterium mitsuokai TaxID=100886 RepID=UPI003CCC5955